MKKELDAVTVAAIGVLAYVVAGIAHEAVGHGGACLAGGTPVAVSSAWFMGD